MTAPTRRPMKVFAAATSLLLASLLVAACGSNGGNESGNGTGNGTGATGGKPSEVTVTLVSHDSFAASKPVLAAFTRQTGIKVKVLKSGDAGAALNQVILTKDHPLGDAFFGVDNTFLSRALDAGIFEPYRAAGLDRVPMRFQLDPDRHRVTPVDYGDVCVNYDKAWFRREGLAVPSSLDDLTKPAYRGRLVVENPATSSPGLAFLLATVAKYGTDGWPSYWAKLRANDVKVDDGWEQAYNSDFSGSAGKGAYPLVISYASSPPAEVVGTKPLPASAPTGVLPATCFRQVETVGLLRGAAHPAAARRLIDFMLSERFQADMPLQMYVFPVREGTPLPPEFAKFAVVPKNPASVPPAEIGRNRDTWIDTWTATVLR